MRIMLKLVLDCDADAAWRALHSPRAIADLYGPIVDMMPMDAAGMPDDARARRRRAGAPRRSAAPWRSAISSSM